jgi:hypothetical protein
MRTAQIYGLCASQSLLSLATSHIEKFLTSYFTIKQIEKWGYYRQTTTLMMSQGLEWMQGDSEDSGLFGS